MLLLLLLLFFLILLLLLLLLSTVYFLPIMIDNCILFSCVESAPGDADDDSCDVSRGADYAPDRGNCHLFYKCQLGRDGKHRWTPKTCKTLIWSEERKRCEEASPGAEECGVVVWYTGPSAVKGTPVRSRTHTRTHAHIRTHARTSTHAHTRTRKADV